MSPGKALTASVLTWGLQVTAGAVGPCQQEAQADHTMPQLVGLSGGCGLTLNQSRSQLNVALGAKGSL